MIRSTSPRLAIHQSGATDLLLWPRQVKLRRVLDQQHEFHLINPPACGFNVWLKDLFGRDFLVVKESIAGRNIGLRLQSCRKADIGHLAQYNRELLSSLGQTLITELTTAKLVR